MKINSTMRITITESITEDDIDSVLLDHMHEDIDWVFVGDMPVKDKLIQFSKKYGIRWEYIPTESERESFSQALLREF